MAVTIGNGDLSVGGAVMETSGGVKYACYVNGEQVTIAKNIDGTPTLTTAYSTAWAGEAGGVIAWIAAAMDSGDDIHVFLWNSGAGYDMCYCVYDTGTDTFGTWEEAYNIDVSATYTPGCAIAIDSSDVPRILLVESDAYHGTDYDQISYGEKSGEPATWQALELVSPAVAGQKNYDSPTICMCPNDDVEAFYYLRSDGYPVHRRRNGTWGTQGDIPASSAVIGFRGVTCTSGDTVYRSWLDQDDDIREGTADTGYNTDSVQERVAAALSPDDGTTRYIFYIDTSDDVHAISNDGGGWTDENAQQTGTYLYVIAEWAYNNENQSGEINYLFDDGTDVYYDAFSLAAPDIYPLPGRWQRDRRLPHLRM